MTKISNVAHTLPLFYASKMLFRMSTFIYNNSMIRITWPALELPLQMDANLSLVVLTKCVIKKSVFLLSVSQAVKILRARHQNFNNRNCKSQHGNYTGSVNHFYHNTCVELKYFTHQWFKKMNYTGNVEFADR